METAEPVPGFSAVAPMRGIKRIINKTRGLKKTASKTQAKISLFFSFAR
jgi:hypothetical protein